MSSVLSLSKPLGVLPAPLPWRVQPASASLPIPLTSLIDREEQVAAAEALLLSPDVRLVTVTGPGGVGKTRLAIQVAANVADHFSNGVAFVSLAPTTDPGLVVSAVAQVLGVREARNQPLVERLQAYLRDKQTLLVLDNFEQVLGAAPLVATLLGACPGLTCLITSRALLRVSGEHDVVVPPLALPDLSRLSVTELPRFDAIRLFTERAQAVNADFVLTANNAAAVAAICVRLDGLPLAIELAAARINMLAPHAMLARLERRLPLLTGGALDQPARLRTMRDAITWSYDLLNPAEQRLFRHLSVFAGGFTLDAITSSEFRAQEEKSELDLIASLVDKSLLRLENRISDLGTPSESRFLMLETVREFGLEQLDGDCDREDVRRRHALYYLGLAEAAQAELRGHEQSLWLARLEAESDNLRIAMRWALDQGEANVALRLTGALHWFWYLHGHLGEGRRWLEAAVTLPAAGGTAERAKALAGAGILAYDQADYPTTSDRLEESVAAARALGDVTGVAYGLHFLGLMAYRQGNYAAMRAHLEESVALYRQAGDPWGLAIALCSLGFETPEQPGSAGRSLQEESLALCREVGDAWCLARVANCLGETARAEGDFDRAEALYNASLARQRALGDRNAAALVLHNLGYVAQAQGDPRRGLRAFAEALTVHAEHGDQRGVAHCLAGVAGMVGLLGKPATAARLFGAAQILFDTTGAVMDPVDRLVCDLNVRSVRERLGDASFTAAWEAGRTLTANQATDEALAIPGMAGPAVTGETTSRRRGEELPDSLSRREREVLRLLADGRSDHEIAAALFITRRTASKHVAAILDKLGVMNRTAAVAFAVRQSLI